MAKIEFKGGTLVIQDVPGEISLEEFESILDRAWKVASQHSPGPLTMMNLVYEAFKRAGLPNPFPPRKW